MNRKSFLLVAVASAVLATSAGSAQEASRYPYDPVCEWGRIANGKGMLVRCITHDEAARLMTLPPAPQPVASTAAAPSASAAVPEAPPAEDESATLAGIVVTADQGKLPAAEKKLALGKEKFLDCIAKNGGLEKPEGEVYVRFLVGDRGRAQGVSVQKRVAVGDKAAKCVADVVDRRWVGTPEAPMVGATAVVKFSRVKK
jgi:hypothetical protein